MTVPSSLTQIFVASSTETETETQNIQKAAQLMLEQSPCKKLWGLGRNGTTLSVACSQDSQVACANNIPTMTSEGKEPSPTRKFAHSRAFGAFNRLSNNNSVTQATLKSSKQIDCNVRPLSSSSSQDSDSRRNSLDEMSFLFEDDASPRSSALLPSMQPAC